MVGYITRTGEIAIQVYGERTRDSKYKGWHDLTPHELADRLKQYRTPD